MASTSNSADIGIRVFLQDSASTSLNALDAKLGKLGITAKGSGLLFADMSAALAKLAIVSGLAASFLGFGGAIVYSVKQAMDLQDALVQIANATDLTTNQMQQLSPFLLNLGANSIYSLQQLADGISVVGQYGFKTTQQIKDMSSAAVKLAEATNSDTVTAFKLLAVTMQAFNIPASKANDTAALLFYSIEHGTPDIGALTSALGQLGGVAVDLHVSLQDIVPALDTVTVGMGSATSAAAGLRYFLVNIVHPTTAASEELRKLGISAFDAQGNFVGLNPLLQELYDKVQGLSDKAKSDVLGTLFNIRSGTAIKQLTTQLGEYEQSVKNVSNAEKNKKDLDAAVARVMGELSSIITVVTSNLRDFAALVGQSLIPQLSGFLNATIVPVVQKMREWAQDPSSQQIISRFLLLGTAVSGVGLLIIGTFMSPLVAFLAIMAGVMAAVTGVALLIQHWKEVLSLLQPVIDKVKAALPGLATALLLVAAGLLAIKGAQIYGQLTSLASSLLSAASAAWTATSAFFTGTIPSLWAQVSASGAATVAWLKGLIPAMARAAAQAWATTTSFLSGIVPALLRVISSTASAVAGFVVGLVPALIRTAISAWGATTSFLSGLGPALIRAGISAWTATTGFIAGLGPALVGAAAAAWSAVTSFLAGLIPALIGTATATWGAAIATLALVGPYLLIGALIVGAVVGLVLLVQHLGFLNTLLALGKAAWNAILPSLQQAGNEIKGTFVAAIKQLQPVWQQLVQAFHQAEPALLVLGKVLGGILVVAIGLAIGVIRGLINVFVAVITTVIRVVAGIIQAFSGIIQFFSGLFTVIHGIFTGNFKEIQAGFTQMGQGILNIVKGLWNAVSSVFVGAFNVIKGFITGFIQGIIGFFQHLFNTLVGHSIVPDMMGQILGAFLGLGPRVLGAVINMIGGLIGHFRGLPGNILHALGNLGGLLFGAGQSLVNGFLNGIKSIWNSITNFVSNGLQSVRNLFPHSPAKEGPLTDAHLWMPNLVHMLADTGEKAAPSLYASMSRVAGVAKSGLASTAGGGSSGGANGGATYTFVVDGKAFMSFFHNQLTGQLQANGVGRLLK